MLFVLVGVRGAGKTTLLKRLESHFSVLTPSTTRPRRTSTESEYDFVGAWHHDLYAWSIDVGAHKYGMRKSEVARAGDAACVTVFDPLSLPVLENFRAQFTNEIVTVGLDTVTDTAEQSARVSNDPSRIMTPIEFEQARSVVQNCDLVVTGPPEILETAALTFVRIMSSRGGVLVSQDISALVNAGALVTEANGSQIQSASYDLSLGDQVWIRGKLIELSDANPTAVIPPYSYAIVIAREIAAIPKYITARFDLTVSLFLRGVILSNGPQVDPGYRGPFFCMLFNGSGAERHLVRGRHFATVEFTTTTGRAAGYHQQYQLQKRLEQIMDEAAISSPGGNLVETLDKLKLEMSTIKEPVRNTMWAFIGVMVAIFLVLITVVFDRLGEAETALGEAKAASSDMTREIRRVGAEERNLTIQTGETTKAQVSKELEQRANTRLTPGPHK